MPISWLLLVLASVAGGVINAVSGGGTLVTFPTLLALGVPPVTANATNTAALMPGVLASSLGYREDFGEVPHPWAQSLISIVGGGVGAAILLLAPASTFQRVIPYLLLLATVLFALSGRIRQMAAHPRFGSIQRGGVQQTSILLGVVFVVSIYGGYFGAGIGLMLLATFALLGFKNINAMNAMRTLLGTTANAAAVVAFAVSGAIDWPIAGLMLCGSVLGGYAGSRVARRMNPTVVRWAIVAFGAFVTVWYFLRG